MINLTFLFGSIDETVEILPVTTAGHLSHFPILVHRCQMKAAYFLELFLTVAIGAFLVLIVHVEVTGSAFAEKLTNVFQRLRTDTNKQKREIKQRCQAINWHTKHVASVCRHQTVTAEDATPPNDARYCIALHLCYTCVTGCIATHCTTVAVWLTGSFEEWMCEVGISERKEKSAGETSFAVWLDLSVALKNTGNRLARKCALLSSPCRDNDRTCHLTCGFLDLSRRC